MIVIKIMINKANTVGMGVRNAHKRTVRGTAAPPGANESPCIITFLVQGTTN